MSRSIARRLRCHPTTPPLPKPLPYLTYAGAQRECPERQRELTVKLAVSQLASVAIPKNRREMPRLQSIGWPPFRNRAASGHAMRHFE
jgi:hypothetical protein